MAPEQILQKPIDARADLYALGCVAVWLLSGKAPFEHDNALAMMAAHLTQPPDLSALVQQGLPPELASVIEQCLQKSPDDRPSSARALAASLSRITLPTAEMWSMDRARAWWAERRSGPPPPNVPPRALSAPSDDPAIASG
jgi:serine/threonine-protein kinase